MSKYIFGPVPSRRLGRSLGIDLAPFKTCSFDCIYCQLGCTTCKTIERKEWAPCGELLAELEGKLATRPDYITLSGSGEPTLYARLDALIAGIKRMTDIPVAVLTNGSLLWQDEVREQLAAADLVMPSLDAGDAATYERLNRPHEAVTFDRLLDGLLAFRRSYGGRYWLESLLVAGVTDAEPALTALRDCVARIAPERLLLGTVTRPPAESFARPVPPARLREIAATFSPPGEVLEHHSETASVASPASCEDVLALLARRPCTVDDIAAGLRMHKVEVLKYVEALLSEGRIEAKPGAQGHAYALRHDGE